jgi:hypothetical protein
VTYHLSSWNNIYYDCTNSCSHHYSEEKSNLLRREYQRTVHAVVRLKHDKRSVRAGCQMAVDIRDSQVQNVTSVSYARRGGRLCYDGAVDRNPVGQVVRIRAVDEDLQYVSDLLERAGTSRALPVCSEKFAH